MADYSDVTEILDSQYKWTVEPSAAPHPDPVNKALKEGRGAETIASQINAYAKRFPPPPAGYEDQSEDGVWAYKLYHSFGAGSHYVKTNTNIALGYSSEDAPLPSVPPAHTAQDAWEIAMQGWYCFGDTRAIDMTTPEGQAEMARRMEFARVIPLSWSGVDPNLYRYFVILNLVPSQPTAYGVRQSELATEYTGCTLQMYVDNQWYARTGSGPVWGPGGIRQ